MAYATLSLPLTPPEVNAIDVSPFLPTLPQLITETPAVDTHPGEDTTYTVQSLGYLVGSYCPPPSL